MSWRYRQLRCTQCGREAIGRHLYGGPLCVFHLKQAKAQEELDKAAGWEQKLDPTLAEAINQIRKDKQNE